MADPLPQRSLQGVRVGRAIAFHPPLFAVFPVLSIYSANLAIIPLSDLWRPLIAAAFLSLAVWIICSLVGRSLTRGAMAASVVCGTLFLYSPVTSVAPFLHPVWAWGACVVFLSLLMAKLVTNPFFPNLVGALLVGVSLSGVLLGEARSQLDIRRVEVSTPSSAIAKERHLPDIFYVILDGYGRKDALQRVLNFDNSSFIMALERRGFYVAPKSHSNYVQTEISLGSSLNMDFIPNLLPKVASNSSNRYLFDQLIADSAVARFLRDHGYRTYAITSGFPALRFPLSDVWMKQASNTSLFETTLLQMTPLIDTDRETESQFLWRRSALLGALKNAASLRDPSPRPRFVFVHVLAPHPPFVFGPHGELVRHKGPFGYWDGSDYMTFEGSAKRYRDGYVAQTQFLNGKVLEMLDALLSSNERPVILLQGDHGSKMRLDQNDLSKTDANECFSNLSAFYVPGETRQELYPSETPVNSFRILFRTLFAAKLPNLPDRSWYSPFGRPFEFTDVTSRVAVGPRP